MLEYNTEIQASYGNLAPLVDWCQRNCNQDWQFTLDEPAGSTNGIYHFYFADRRDYVNFLLFKK